MVSHYKNGRQILSNNNDENVISTDYREQAQEFEPNTFVLPRHLDGFKKCKRLLTYDLLKLF